jgi:hypothetical protein
MTSIGTLVLEVPDLAAATEFYDAAFDLGPRLELRASDAPSSGFRGFTLSLLASQPSNVDALFASALQAGASTLKPLKKNLWGYGGVVQAPDGAIWKMATSKRKDTGAATKAIDDLVLLLGVGDVPASKRFYLDRGLEVARSFGRRYVEFAAPPSAGAKLALYGRRALAKDAGVPEEGGGAHRIVLRGGSEPFSDPDGFGWEPAASADAGAAGVAQAANA